MLLVIIVVNNTHNGLKRNQRIKILKVLHRNSVMFQTNTEAAPAIGMGTGERHTKARLAVVGCWGGSEGGGHTWRRRCHLMGQHISLASVPHRDKGWSAVLLSVVFPAVCISMYHRSYITNRGLLTL